MIAQRAGGLRIAVLGYIVRGPLGGLVWHHLQYLLGLARSGHDVAFIEDSGDDGWSGYDPQAKERVDFPAFGLDWTSELFRRVELTDRWAYYDARRATWHGPFGEQAEAFCSTADIILNISGVNVLRPWSIQPGCRVLIDTDPVFTQVRHLTDDRAMEQARLHTAYFTFGEAFARGGAIPDDGLPWIPTRQPVLIDRWAYSRPPRLGRYTTVMQWSSYPAVEYGGVTYDMKSASFGAFETLPQHVPVELELALGSSDAPVQALRDLGWKVVDPFPPTRDAWAFQEYVRGSTAEFSIAKHGYVVSKSGWFSERSANYLSSGRPVIAQDTGFANHIPAGRGLFAVSSVEEAVDAIDLIEHGIDDHSRAAREIATEYFESSRVLSALIERAGMRPEPTLPTSGTTSPLRPATPGGSRKDPRT
jgi:hypothetical protein